MTGGDTAAYAGAYGVGGDRTEPEVTEVATARQRSVPSAQPARRPAASRVRQVGA